DFQKLRNCYGAENFGVMVDMSEQWAMALQLT
ncbi:MAG: hypothetical protein CG445_328, partial [Methanosaeta sp. ASM2]